MSLRKQPKQIVDAYLPRVRRKSINHFNYIASLEICSVIQTGGIGGHDFLRNLVHLPVYLQNSGLRKVQRAQNTALMFRRNIMDMQNEDGPLLTHSTSTRKLSNASEIMSSNEKLRAPMNTTRNSSKKLRMSESIASSIGSNLHRISTVPQGPIDLSKIVLTDDYFSDVNPRSMRRLMNVIYITGKRLPLID